jgi:hypothetical protein
LAAEFVTAGYTAEQVLSTPVPDPSHPEESLDTSHEVRLSMPVPNSTALILELKRAMERRRYTSDE